MATFTDNSGREHELVVTIHTLRQLKKPPLAFDLPKLLVAGSSELQRVIEDPVILCDLAFFITQLGKPESEQISPESFYQAMAGDALNQAHSALIEALADFCPSPEERAFLRDLKTKAEGAAEAKFAMARRRLEMIDLEKLSSLPSMMPLKSESPMNLSPPSESPSSSAESSDLRQNNSTP